MSSEVEIKLSITGSNATLVASVNDLAVVREFSLTRDETGAYLSAGESVSSEIFAAMDQLRLAGENPPPPIEFPPDAPKPAPERVPAAKPAKKPSRKRSAKPKADPKPAPTKETEPVEDWMLPFGAQPTNPVLKKKEQS